MSTENKKNDKTKTTTTKTKTTTTRQEKTKFDSSKNHEPDEGLEDYVFYETIPPTEEDLQELFVRAHIPKL
jgi:hypothetical protein